MIGPHTAGAEAGRTANATRSPQSRYFLLKPASKLAVQSTFSFPYPYGNHHKLLEIGLFLDVKTIPSKTLVSGSTNGSSESSFALRTGIDAVTQTKSFSTVDLRQRYGWVAKIHRCNRIVIFRKKEEVAHCTKTRKAVGAKASLSSVTILVSARGHIFLPDDLINSAAYWKNKIIDVKQVATRKRRSLFITITINIWKEAMKQLSMDHSIRPSFPAKSYCLILYDLPDFIAKVCNQYANEFMKDFEKIAEHIFRIR